MFLGEWTFWRDCFVLGRRNYGLFLSVSHCFDHSLQLKRWTAQQKPFSSSHQRPLSAWLGRGSAVMVELEAGRDQLCSIIFA